MSKTSKWRRNSYINLFALFAALLISCFLIYAAGKVHESASQSKGTQSHQQELHGKTRQELTRQESARYYFNCAMSFGLQYQELYDSKFYDSLGYRTDEVDSINAKRKFINSEIDYARSASRKMIGVDTIILVDTNLSKVVYSYHLYHKLPKLYGDRPFDNSEAHFITYCSLILYYDLPKEDAIIVSKLWNRSVRDFVISFDDRYLIVHGSKFDYVIVKSLKQ